MQTLTFGGLGLMRFIFYANYSYIGAFKELKHSSYICIATCKAVYGSYL